jgi:hypothetical protein
MQEPTKQVTPLDPTPTEFVNGIRIGRWSRWLKPERPMWPMLVVMLDVDAQNLLQMAASHDQQPVQALSAHRADPALREGVRVGRLDRSQHDLGALGAEDVVEATTELCVPILQDIPNMSPLLAEYQQRVACLRVTRT